MGLSPPFPPTRHHSLAHLASKGQSDAHHLGRLSWYRLCLNCTCVQSGRAGRTCPPVLAFVVWLVVLAWLLCSACIVVVKFLNGVAHPLCWTVLLFCFRTVARTFGFFSHFSLYRLVSRSVAGDVRRACSIVPRGAVAAVAEQKQKPLSTLGNDTYFCCRFPGQCVQGRSAHSPRLHRPQRRQHN